MGRALCDLFAWLFERSGVNRKHKTGWCRITHWISGRLGTACLLRTPTPTFKCAVHPGY
ncbi:hypothetical protein GPB2148_3504 [marine gamma proteobacterium HTCC2148]|nr:hypothetical protein GPB2148_3504 [marine gamma proteobacterium HTCC2148]